MYRHDGDEEEPCPNPNPIVFPGTFAPKSRPSGCICCTLTEDIRPGLKQQRCQRWRRVPCCCASSGVSTKNKTTKKNRGRCFSLSLLCNLCLKPQQSASAKPTLSGTHYGIFLPGPACSRKYTQNKPTQPKTTREKNKKTPHTVKNTHTKKKNGNTMPGPRATRRRRSRPPCCGSSASTRTSCCPCSGPTRRGRARRRWKTWGLPGRGR